MLSGRGVFSFFLWFRKITIGALRRRSRGDEKSVPQNAARKDRNKNENGKLICSESAVGRDINLLHDNNGNIKEFTYVGSDKVYRTTDEGKTWQDITP